MGAAEDLLRRLLPAIGINAIPIVGVFLRGWSPATALSLYWWENLLGALLVALRIVIHRALTKKRGYQRLQLGLQSASEGQRAQVRWRQGRPPQQERKGSFLVEFVVAAVAATAVHGLVLFVVIAKVLTRGPDHAAVLHGVLGVAAFQVGGFLLDLRGIRERPFSWVREQAQSTFNRVLLIHLVLIAGMWLGLHSGTVSFFGPFAVIKALADLGNLLARFGVRADPEEMPAWVVATMNRLGPEGDDFGEYWRAQKAEERRLLEQDEQVARRA